MSTEQRAGSKNVLLFDGVCGLCTLAVQAILARDPGGVIQFCSIQSETGSRLYREQGYDPQAPQSMVLLTERGALAESDAAIEIGRLLGGWQRWLVLLKVIPRPIRNWGYRLVARNRYRWFGRREECLMPKPEWRARFVCE